MQKGANNVYFVAGIKRCVANVTVKNNIHFFLKYIMNVNGGLLKFTVCVTRRGAIRRQLFFVFRPFSLLRQHAQPDNNKVKPTSKRYHTIDALGEQKQPHPGQLFLCFRGSKHSTFSLAEFCTRLKCWKNVDAI